MSTTFEDFPLHPALLVGLERSEFKAPTPLQAHTIPAIFDGRDVVAQAKHGAGQTLSFGLPILSLLDRGPKPQALILVPNRDRCMRVWDVISAIGADTGLEAIALHSGLGLTQQQQMLRRGADIIVGTPGRVNDLLQYRLDLSEVRIVVLDGADVMVEEGFRRDIETLLGRMPAREQTLVFTGSMPDELAAFTRKQLKDPVMVGLTDISAKPAPAREKAAAAPAPAARSEAAASASLHFFVRVDGDGHLDALVSLMEADQPQRALVYVDQPGEIKRMASRLERETGLRTGCVTTDMSANARSSMLGRFRSGDHRVLLVADSQASLDGVEASHVFFFEVPTMDGPAGVPAIYLVSPDGEEELDALRERVACEEMSADGARLPQRPAAKPAAKAASAAAATTGPDREPRRRNRLGVSRPMAHGQDPGALLSSVSEEKVSTGPLAPLPRMRMSWQTFKVALQPGRRPNRDTVHSWLAQATGVARSSLRSIVVNNDHCTVEVEGREVEKFQRGLQDLLISS